MQTLIQLPYEFMAMYNAVASLPPHDPSAADQVGIPPSEPGKRPWETSKTGYLNWAIEQLLSKAKERGQDEGSSAVGVVANTAFGVAQPEDVKAALQAFEASAPGSTADVSMDLD